MAKEFNPQQSDFVSSMGGSFRSNTFDNATALWILGILLAAVIFFAWAYLNRKRLKVWSILLRKRLKGEPLALNRKRLSREIRIRLEGDQVIEASTYDLSPQGFFVRINPPLPKNQDFQFSIFPEKGDSIRGTARVLWVQEKWSPWRPTGNGCRIFRMTQRDEIHLADLLKAARG